MTTPSTERPAVEPPPDFPFAWHEPRDAELSWDWDDMHMPYALLPMAGDYVLEMATGFAYGYERLALPIEIKARIWNGYAYFAADVGAPEAEEKAVWERRTVAARAQIPVTDAYWRERALPELREIYAWVAGLAVERLPLDDLADLWDPVWERTQRCWSIHFYAIRGPYQVLEDLADLYESVVPDATPGEALALIGGEVDELQDVEVRIEALVDLVRATDGVAAALNAPDVTLAQLAERPGFAPFVAAVEAFLADHGHLGQPFDDLALPSWGEEPHLLLVELAKRVEHPPAVDAGQRREQLAARAATLEAAVRARLEEEPERRASFDAVLAHARRIGPLTEGHNYWIDRMAQASLRRFVMRVAARLVEAGVLEDAADILFLRRSEVPDLLRRRGNLRGLIAARRAEHAHWRSIDPPRTLGVPAPHDDEGDRFDGARFEATEPDELRGTGASVGVARGTARVVLDQDGFGSVQPGDIIVCPSSNPSWVPLFAIAGGLITNTGGVLSHAAVVAREFALPAVVGTRDATTRIADGRLVELDGSSGIVRLL